MYPPPQNWIPVDNKVPPGNWFPVPSARNRFPVKDERTLDLQGPGAQHDSTLIAAGSNRRRKSACQNRFPSKHERPIDSLVKTNGQSISKRNERVWPPKRKINRRRRFLIAVCAFVGSYPASIDSGHLFKEILKENCNKRADDMKVNWKENATKWKEMKKTWNEKQLKRNKNIMIP